MQTGQVTTTAGNAIRWTETGTGNRTLVFVHGVTLTADEWKSQVQALRADYRVITIDQRGHGESSAWDTPASVADSIAADLAEVLEQLDLANVVLVGHSLGGIAVLQFLCDYRGIRDARVEGAVLISTTGTLRFLTESPFGARLPLRKVEERLLRTVPKRVPWLIRKMKRKTGLEGCTRETLEAVFCALAEYHVHERLAQVPTPVRVVCGAKDKVTPPFLSRKLADLLPGAHLHVVDEAGHGLVSEQPEVVTSHVEAFAGQLALAS